MERFTPSEEETAILVASPTKVTNLDALDAASRDEHQQAMNKKQQSSGVSIPSMYTGVSSQRSLSSSSSGADSLLSNISSENSYSSGSRSSTNATSDEIIGEDEEDEYTSSETDDEKSSSGHTVTRTPSAVDKRVKTNIVLTRSLSSSLADDSVNNSNKPSQPTYSSHSTSSRYLSHLPVVANNSQHNNNNPRRVIRHNTLATIPAASQGLEVDYRPPYTTATAARHRGSFGANTSSGGRAHSTSPRHNLSRSYTTSAVSTMAIAPVSAGPGHSPPQAFLPTSSVAPPVQNSASVTFAPAPQVFTSTSSTSTSSSSRPRSYSTGARASTLSSPHIVPPTSPALATIASLTTSEAFSPRSAQSPSSSSSSPPAHIDGGGNNAVLNPWKTSSSSHTPASPESPPYRSSAAALNHQYYQPISPASNTGSTTNSSSPPPNSAPYHVSPVALRRHSVDPYGTSGNINILNTNITSAAAINNSNVATANQQFTSVVGQTTATAATSLANNQRRHHQSVSIPASEYSSIGDHINNLNSRYRKVSLGSQTLLSPSTGDLMPSAPGSSVQSVLSPGSSLERRQQLQHQQQHNWDPTAHQAHHSHSRSAANPESNAQQLSPTRSRTDPYLATSPRYSGRGSHDNPRANHLEAKIVLLGRQGVGKTSLVHRYMTGKFSSSLPMTIGASFLTKKLDFEGGMKVRLQIWDTAGQERFRSMAPMYYRGAHAAILVYDITNEDSLADIQVWLDELRRNMSSDLIVHIVGNKADLANSARKIQLADAKAQISKWIAQPMQGVETSTLAVPTGRRSTSGGTSSPRRSGEDSSALANVTAGAPGTSRSGMTGLASFSLSRSGSRQKATEEQEPAAPAFKDWGVEEVSAKEDEGIDMLFATIAGKLVERKSQIEHERVLRTKDSIMITDEMKGKLADSTRVWGCC